MRRAVYIISGSREWPGDPSRIRASLQDFASRWRAHGNEGELVLFHGDCPHQNHGVSVDAVAAEVAPGLGFQVVPFKADWYRGGTLTKPDATAGPDRNARMSREGYFSQRDGDHVRAHGWPGPRSRGTWGFIRLAHSSGLFVYVHPCM